MKWNVTVKKKSYIKITPHYFHCKLSRYLWINGAGTLFMANNDNSSAGCKGMSWNPMFWSYLWGNFFGYFVSLRIVTPVYLLQSLDQWSKGFVAIKEPGLPVLQSGWGLPSGCNIFFVLKTPNWEWTGPSQKRTNPF